jgi:hypothetical protein
MRCRVDKSCEADAQALGLPPKYHGTLILVTGELSHHTISDFMSRLFKRWLMYEESDVLLEGSMQGDYAWIDEIDESAWQEFGTVFHGTGVLYEYRRKGQLA